MADTNISFLDVISCGFGAIVLLLLIARAVDPSAFEKGEDPGGSVVTLQQQLFSLRSDTTVLTRNLTSREQQLSKLRDNIARLQEQLASIKRQIAAVNEIDTTEKQELALALQVLTEEMERLVSEDSRVENQLIGGIPVDSEYIIFIVDTSGSMFGFAWQRVRREMINILNIYPEVKGIQIMNDMGNLMFSSYRGKWIPDTPGRRKAIIDRLQTWSPFSNSSPVEGIKKAILSFYSADKNISLFVFGDDFTGRSIARVLDTVELMNKQALNGERRVRIHTVGFPVHFLVQGGRTATAARFANLMRELSYRNGGTFVGLSGLN